MRRGFFRLCHLVALGMVLTGCDRSEPPVGFYVVQATGVSATDRVITGFNDRGDISGHEGAGAFRVSGGAITRLTSLPGATETHTSAMNDLGDIVGYAQTTAGRRTLKWPAGGAGYVEMPGIGSEPADINDHGDVVLQFGAYSTTLARDTAIVVWSATGLEFIPIPNIGIVRPYAINNSRDVLGSAQISHLGTLPFLAGVTTRTLQQDCPWGSPGMQAGGPVALNDEGAYVISYDAGQQCLVAPGLGAQRLAFEVRGRQLNNGNRMIGFLPSIDGPGTQVVAEGLKYTPLASLFASDGDRAGWEIGQLLFINDRNEILASAIKDGLVEFVILKPRG